MRIFECMGGFEGVGIPSTTLLKDRYNGYYFWQSYFSNLCQTSEITHGENSFSVPQVIQMGISIILTQLILNSYCA